MRNEGDGINWIKFNFSRAVASFPHRWGRLDYDIQGNHMQKSTGNLIFSRQAVLKQMNPLSSAYL